LDSAPPSTISGNRHTTSGNLRHWPESIGAKLGISRKTVTSHRARILIRMNMKSDAELTISFERNKPPDRQSVGEKPQYSPKPQPRRVPAPHEGYFPLNGWCLPSPSPV